MRYKLDRWAEDRHSDTSWRFVEESNSVETLRLSDLESWAFYRIYNGYRVVAIFAGYDGPSIKSLLTEFPDYDGGMDTFDWLEKLGRRVIT